MLTDSTSRVSVFMISLPPGFKHLVRLPADLKVSNQKLPLMRGSSDWLDAALPNRLRILLESSDSKIDAGVYQLSFPVSLPESLSGVSPWNLWFLSACSERRFCSSTSDRNVFVSFPM